MIDPWHIWTVIYMIDVRRIWNVIYNARSNRSHPPTSPNTAPATQNDCDDWSASDMKRHLQCAEQQESQSNFTKYCACHAKWISWLIRVSHTWNVIYNERSNRNHNPTSPNTAPATQNESHDCSASHMKRHLQCAEQQTSQDKFTKYCTCHAKWISWLIRVTYETSFTMSGATRITIQLHQILRLPRKMNLMIDRHHIWNVIYNARSKQSHPPTSPNIAPATQNESHEWSASHVKRHLQCAKQQESPSNFTKYCACHAKWMSSVIRVTYETSFPMRGASKVTLQTHQVLRLPRNSEFKISGRNPWIASANIKTIRRHSEDIRAWNRHLAPAASETWLVPSWRRILYWKIQHFALRLSPKMSPNAAPATKSHTPTSPNTAPATQNESHDWSASHMKRHFQCAEQAKSTSNLSKYCACHAKWISWLIRVTHETSFTMRGASTVSHQPHQILRLPRNLYVQDFSGKSVNCFRQ